MLTEFQSLYRCWEDERNEVESLSLGIRTPPGESPVNTTVREVREGRGEQNSAHVFTLLPREDSGMLLGQGSCAAIHAVCKWLVVQTL